MKNELSVAIVMSIVLVAASHASQFGRGGVSNREVAARVPSEYKALYEGGIPADRVSQVWAGFPYDSIELERTACFGMCPVYRVTLSRGGAAKLRRIANTEPLGDFEGEVSVFEYGKLCYFLKQFGFDELPARYAAGWTDSPTFIVTATSGNRRKVVSDYAGVGPIELWGVQQAIDAVAQRIRWNPK